MCSVGSVSFNFETLDFYDNEPTVIQTADNCNFPSFEISYNNQPFLAESCRCLGHKNFSILTKFKMSDAKGSLMLLSLGNRDNPLQLELVYNGCNKQFNLSFNEDCGSSGQHVASYLFDLDESLKVTDWNRFAFEITENSISLFVNCEKKATIMVPRSSCRISCSDSDVSHVNNIIQEFDRSPCGGNVARKVILQPSCCHNYYSFLFLEYYITTTGYYSR